MRWAAACLDRRERAARLRQDVVSALRCSSVVSKLGRLKQEDLGVEARLELKNTVKAGGGGGACL